ncbi:hypothetical protein [Lentzea sp. E54]|uniref:hypothetical protein n=1 Tax=Lentzea xerophila TaxID=3435883 RepID=UPI003DA5F0F8
MTTKTELSGDSGGHIQLLQLRQHLGGVAPSSAAITWESGDIATQKIRSENDRGGLGLTPDVPGTG